MIFNEIPILFSFLNNMAADTPATSDIDINTDVIVVETFGLIWLDNDVNAKDTRDTEQKLRSIVNRLKKFEDVKQCQKYIEERPSQDRLIMIANGPLGQEIVPYIHQCRQLISIYVYCKNKISNMAWIEKFPKVTLCGMFLIAFHYVHLIFNR